MEKFLPSSEKLGVLENVVDSEGLDLGGVAKEIKPLNVCETN